MTRTRPGYETWTGARRFVASGTEVAATPVGRTLGAEEGDMRVFGGELAHRGVKSRDRAGQLIRRDSETGTDGYGGL
jgi:hypothetical protein